MKNVFAPLPPLIQEVILWCVIIAIPAVAYVQVRQIALNVLTEGPQVRMKSVFALHEPMILGAIPYHVSAAVTTAQTVFATHALTPRSVLNVLAVSM